MKKNIKNIKKILKHISKRREFIPSMILAIATIVIITIGYLFINQSPQKKTIQKTDWKTKSGLYIPIEITSFTPKKLPTTGGKIIIKGQGFSKKTKIYIGAKTNIHQRTLEAKITKTTTTQIEAQIPPHPKGDIYIYTTYQGNVIGPNEPLVFSGNPVKSKTPIQLTGITPENPTLSTNNTITIQGSGFSHNNTIKFGQGTIPNIDSKNGTEIIITIPTTLNTPIGTIPVQPNKYDISITSNNQESNFETLEISK